MNEKELERLNREHDEESLSGMTMQKTITMPTKA
jgi:hypothetical protein